MKGAYGAYKQLDSFWRKAKHNFWHCLNEDEDNYYKLASLALDWAQLEFKYVMAITLQECYLVPCQIVHVLTELILFNVVDHSVVHRKTPCEAPPTPFT